MNYFPEAQEECPGAPAPESGSTIHLKCIAFPRSLGVSGTTGAIPGPSCEIHDLSQMSSISAEFGSLPKTHLLVLLRARELQVNSHHKDWLISGSFGSFALTGNPGRARCVIRGPRPSAQYYLFSARVVRRKAQGPRLLETPKLRF